MVLCIKFIKIKGLYYINKTMLNPVNTKIIYVKVYFKTQYVNINYLNHMYFL